MHRWKRAVLYDMEVCRRCNIALANCREMAFLVDWLFWKLGAMLLMVAILDALQAQNLPVGPDLAYWAAELFIPFAFIFKDGFSGMSPGKWLFNVQVVDVETREPTGFFRSAKRNLILLLPYLGVLIVICQFMKGPRIGDRWARTAVIWRKHAHKPPFDPRGIRCTTCGYNLTGNVSGICPECGTPIPAKKAQPVSGSATATS